MSLPKLWAHQEKAIDTAKNRFALFFDPGCGKTRTAFELFNKQFAVTKNKHAYFKCCIFAPLNVCRNWMAEIERYADYEYEVMLCAGHSKYIKQKIINEFGRFNEAPNPKPRFLICNIEVLRGSEYRSALKNSRCNFFIVDESHNFKSPTSQQTKGLLEVIEYIKPTHLYLLTGTPCPNGELDLWSTFRLLKVTTDSFFIWRKKYFEDKNARRAGTHGYYPDYVIKPSSKETFNRQLAECSMTARKEEVLELPDYVRTNIYCELSPQQSRHYKTMREFLFAADEEGNELNATNVLSRTLRMQQIIGGILGDVLIKDNPRLQALNDAIEMIELADTNAQFVIWTIFRPTYEALGLELNKRGILHAFLTGNETPEQRNDNITLFQSGHYRVLVANPSVGGVGINLTAASYSIHYLKSYSLTNDMQSEARNYRGGSEIHKKITRIDIVAQDTIDEDINEALARKKTVQEFIMGLKK